MEITVSVYLKKGAVSRCTALSVCLEILLLETSLRVRAEQGMTMKGVIITGWAIPFALRNTVMPLERDRARDYLLPFQCHIGGDLCAQREFSVTLMGPVRDVLPRVRHRQHCNYLLASWVWETGKCFAKLNPEYNLGEAQKLCCGFHHLFYGSVLHELLKVSFLVSPLSKIARISHFAGQHHFQAKHNKYSVALLGTSCSAAFVLAESHALWSIRGLEYFWNILLLL